MFYLAIIQNDETQALYRYPDYDTALAKFHSELAYRAAGRRKTVCTILNSLGELVKTEYWELENADGESQD